MGVNRAAGQEKHFTMRRDKSFKIPQINPQLTPQNILNTLICHLSLIH